MRVFIFIVQVIVFREYFIKFFRLENWKAGHKYKFQFTFLSPSHNLVFFSFTFSFTLLSFFLSLSLLLLYPRLFDYSFFVFLHCLVIHARARAHTRIPHANFVASRNKDKGEYIPFVKFEIEKQETKCKISKADV